MADELGDLGCRLGRSLEHVAVGERVVAGAAPARHVDLESAAAAVVAVAEQLDCQPKVRPMAIDLVAAVIDVRSRSRQTVRGEQLQEAVFEHAEGDVAAQRATQLRRPGLVRIARDAGLDVPRSRPVTDPGLVAGAAELIGGEARREVQQHARRMVIGMPLSTATSSECSCDRWIVMPGRLRDFESGMVTSGGGGEAVAIVRIM